jgi:DNA-binding MarR family transcriptional regulator
MKPTTKLAVQLKVIQVFLNNPEIQAQQILTLLHVGQVGELPMADLAELTGVSQSSVSRNVAKLGRGATSRDVGAGLVEAYEDPDERRRKLVKVTSRGRELIKQLDAVK